MSNEKKIAVIGLGLPQNYRPPGKDVFPSLVDWEPWTAVTLTVRERCMLKFIEDITNKPEWWVKVQDPEISARWAREVLEMPWTEFHQYGNFSESMADAVSLDLDVEGRQI